MFLEGRERKCKNGIYKVNFANVDSLFHQCDASKRCKQSIFSKALDHLYERQSLQARFRLWIKDLWVEGLLGQLTL